MHFLRIEYPMPTFGIWSRPCMGSPPPDRSPLKPAGTSVGGQALVRGLMYEGFPPLCKGRVGGVEQRRGIRQECQWFLNLYRAGVALIVVLGLYGCGGGVQVIRESPDSGVVRYLYKGDDGHLSTSKRTEAFDKIREFCRGPYQVLKEGKTKGRQRVVEGMGGAEIVTEDWWGIRFQCTK